MKSTLTHLTGTLLIALLVASVVVLASNWFGLSTMAWPPKASTLVQLANAATLPTSARQGVAFRVDRTLVGKVDLSWGATGTYSDTLPTPTAEELAALPNMGSIDLALLLEQGAGNGVKGYVALESTLVFTTQHTISATVTSAVAGRSTTETRSLAVGPASNGSYQGNQLTLLSERIAYTTASGQAAQRQFRLSAAPSQEVGIVTGEYRETVWGVALQPLTIVGTFRLKDPRAIPADLNSAPVANAQRLNVLLNTPKALSLTGSDAENDALTFTIITAPIHGTLSGNAPNLTYTPAAGYLGSDSFTFSVNDGKVASGAVAITINVAETIAPNTAPVANGQTVNAGQGQARAIPLTGSDADGDPLTFRIVSQPTNGTLTLNGAVATYTPNAGFIGADSFTYVANDATVDSAAVTVMIQVKAEVVETERAIYLPIVQR